MQRPDNELQIRIKECDNPTFGYRRGENGEIEKDVFDGEPLPDGWDDSPAKAGEPHREPFGETPPYVTPGPAPESSPEPEQTVVSVSFGGSSAMAGSAPAPSVPYEDQKFPELRAEYMRLTGKKVRLGVTKPRLIEWLKGLDDGE